MCQDAAIAMRLAHNHNVAMLLTITVPGQQADLLPRLLGMNPSNQHRVVMPDISATLYFPIRADGCSHAALFVEVTPGAHWSPEPEVMPADGLPPALSAPSASQLAAAITRAFLLSPVDRSAESGRNSAEGSVVELPLRISVRHLFQPGNLAKAKDAFHALGWHVTIIEVPFGDMPAYWGKTGFIEFQLAFSDTLLRAMERLCKLLPLLNTAADRDAGDPLPPSMPRDGGQVAGTGLIVGSVALPQIVARFDGPGGYCTVDDLSPPRQGLAAQRIGAVLAVLTRLGARTVVDLGCGRGDLLAILAYDSRYAGVLGVDVDAAAVRLARRRLQLHWLPDHRRVCVRVEQGSFLVPDRRFRGFDAAVLMEVVEHLDLHDVARLVVVIFGEARPRTVCVTTPNAEHTRRFPSVGRLSLRHPDHRFEWTRSEFAQWVNEVASAHGYLADLAGVGSTDFTVGAPTQLAVFVRRD